MSDQYQIPPPSSWEKFERMCADIFAIEWDDPSTQRHGRTGFPQNGVDVYGRTRDQRLHGIQCKKKNLETNSVATIKELKEEVDKALNFQPSLSSFIFATTSPNDPDLELAARNITEQHIKQGLFSVHFLGWDEILDKLWQHEHLVGRYYKWLTPGGDPNEYAYGMWSEKFNSEDLFFNACYLPFRSFSVDFRPSFIVRLCSFINETSILLDSQRTRNLDSALRDAIDNFKKVASDLVDIAVIDEDRYDAGFDIYAYWVNTGKLKYHELSDYIEYRKGVLRSMFYQLILASNNIIDVKNKISQSCIPENSYVKFQRSAYEAVTFPLYVPKDMDNGTFYPGINAVKQLIAAQLSDPVLDYERGIESENCL